MHGSVCPCSNETKPPVWIRENPFFSIFLITIATGLRGTSQTVTVLLTTAFAGGVGISFAGPLLSSFIKKYFPKSPGIVSVYSISMTVGAALASGLTIPIYLRSEHNLPLALSCWAILGVIALILWLGLARQNQQADHADVRLRLPLRNKKAIQFTLFFGFMSSMFYSLTAWISPIALDFGNSPQYAAMLLTIFTLIQIPVALLVPNIVNRLGKPKLFLILCSLSELIGLIFLLLPMPILPAVIFLGIGAGGLFPLALMLPIIETRTPEEAGTWSAMSQMGGYIMGGFGPFLIGLIFDISGHFQAAIVAMLAIVMLMIGVQLSMKLGENVKKDPAHNFTRWKHFGHHV